MCAAGRRENAGHIYCKPGDVHFFDHQRVVTAADSGFHDRIPGAVWQCGADGDCGAGDSGDGVQHVGGGGILQGDESEYL